MINLDFGQYTKPASLRYMFIGVGIGFFLAGLINAVANPILGIIVVIIGLIGEFLMGGKTPAATPKS